MTRTIQRWLPAMLLMLAASSAALAGLPSDVKAAIQSAQFKEGSVAVSIRDAQTGDPLVSINAEAAMIPASNMKLLTTGAALHALGPNFEFRTRLLRAGDRLIVVGDGDPGFGDPELLSLMQSSEGTDLDAEGFLDLWVQAVVKSGMKSISSIVVDDRIFDREFTHPDWPADQLNLRFCAQVSGLNFHLNLLHFFPQPRPGDAPNVSLTVPSAPWLRPVNRATSRTSSDDRNDMWVARPPGTNTLTLHGNCRFAYKVPVPVTLHDMPSFFSQLLAHRLGKAGVEVKEFGVVDPAGPPSAGESAGPAVCTPITTVITRCNRDSQNLYAESLLKRIGAAKTHQPGSWLNGAAILRMVVHERLGDPSLASGLIIADGSGLSRNNRITASLMTAWLNTFHRDDQLESIFINSLGAPGLAGPLENRFQSVNLGQATVRAKTGYISEVSCLSGYVIMPDGRVRTFSILVNDLKEPGAVAKAKKVQEQIVAAIARDMTALASHPLDSH